MEKKAAITLLGGGTGQSNILRGLKKFDLELNSIVTMADDGGSSGMLRDEMAILPPGDVRNCILALSNTEPEMEKLFQYRFSKGSLKGQNFGNLFLAAMNDIHGDMKNAIAQTSKILAVRGNVYPVTYDDITLYADLKNKTTVKGESNIAKESIKQSSRIEKVYIKPQNAKASEDALEAIRNSDVIVAGPGSLYTSIFPVLFIDKISEEIQKSKAIKIFVTNIMSEYGETDGFTSKDFVLEIQKNLKHHLFDYFVINNGILPKDMDIKYKNKNQYKINHEQEDKELFEKLKIKVICKDMIKVENKFIVHDNNKVSNIIKEIFEKNYGEKLKIRI